MTGTAFGNHDLGVDPQAARRPPPTASPCTRATSRRPGRASACGGRARATPRSRSPTSDLGNDAFPYMTAPARSASAPYPSSRYGSPTSASWAGSSTARPSTGSRCGTRCGSRAPRTACVAGRLPRHRRPAAREGIPGLGHRRDAEDNALRGRARLRGAAGQTDAVRRTGRPAPRSRRSGSTRRLRCHRRSPIRTRSRSAPSRCGSTATIVGRVTSGGYGFRVGAFDRLRVRPRRTGRGRHAPSRSRCSASGSRARSRRSRSTTLRARGSARDP